MNRILALRSEQAIGVFKYIIATFMMVVGIATPFSPLQPMSGALGLIYANRFSLVALGVIFFLSGLALFYGKVRKNRAWTGRGLMAIFACFTFAAVLETVARHALSIGNIVAALILAVLYLRWRFQTAYVDPKHFVGTVAELNRDIDSSESV